MKSLTSQQMTQIPTWANLIQKTLGIDTSQCAPDTQPTLEQYATAVYQAVEILNQHINAFTQTTDKPSPYATALKMQAWQNGYVFNDAAIDMTKTIDPAHNSFALRVIKCSQTVRQLCLLLNRIIQNQAFITIEYFVDEKAKRSEDMTPTLMKFLTQGESVTPLSVSSLGLETVPGISIQTKGPQLTHLQQDILLFKQTLTALYQSFHDFAIPEGHAISEEILNTSFIPLIYSLTLLMQYLSYINGEGASFSAEYMPHSRKLLQDCFSEFNYRALLDACIKPLFNLLTGIEQKLSADCQHYITPVAAPKKSKQPKAESHLSKAEFCQITLCTLANLHRNLSHLHACFPEWDIKADEQILAIWHILKASPEFNQDEFSLSPFSTLWPDTNPNDADAIAAVIGEAPGLLTRLLKKLTLASTPAKPSATTVPTAAPLPHPTQTAPSFDLIFKAFSSAEEALGLIDVVNDLYKKIQALNIKPLTHIWQQTHEKFKATFKAVNKIHQKTPNHTDKFLEQLVPLKQALFECQQALSQNRNAIENEAYLAIDITTLDCIKSLQQLTAELDILSTRDDQYDDEKISNTEKIARAGRVFAQSQREAADATVKNAESIYSRFVPAAPPVKPTASPGGIYSTSTPASATATSYTYASDQLRAEQNSMRRPRGAALAAATTAAAESSSSTTSHPHARSVYGPISLPADTSAAAGSRTITKIEPLSAASSFHSHRDDDVAPTPSPEKATSLLPPPVGDSRRFSAEMDVEYTGEDGPGGITASASSQPPAPKKGVMRTLRRKVKSPATGSPSAEDPSAASSSSPADKARKQAYKSKQIAAEGRALVTSELPTLHLGSRRRAKKADETPRSGDVHSPSLILAEISQCSPLKPCQTDAFRLHKPKDTGNPILQLDIDAKLKKSFVTNHNPVFIKRLVVLLQHSGYRGDDVDLSVKAVDITQREMLFRELLKQTLEKQIDTAFQHSPQHGIRVTISPNGKRALIDCAANDVEQLMQCFTPRPQQYQQDATTLVSPSPAVLTRK